MSKYHSRKTSMAGIVFDSKKEAARYQELRLMERGGLIHDLEHQVAFTLIPSQKNELGRTIERPVTYVADFVYKEGSRQVVEDCKGVRTPAYIIKRKMMLYFHGIRIKET